MNLNRGLWRLWLVVNVSWVAFCAYELYSNHKAWEEGFAAAKAQTGVIEGERNLMIQNYVFNAKARHERMGKEGIPVGVFDEARARDEAFSKALRAEQNSEARQLQEQWYREAFDARDRRDAYLPLLPLVPVISGLLFLAIPWVVRGFNRS